MEATGIRTTGTLENISPDTDSYELSSGEDLPWLMSLGQGSHGEAHLHQRASGRRSGEYIVRKTHHTGSEEKGTREILIAEENLRRSLVHPNIIAYRGCFEDDEGTFNLYMNFADCGSLTRLMIAKCEIEKEQLAYIIVCAVTGLRYLHENGIIHCDIK